MEAAVEAGRAERAAPRRQERSSAWPGVGQRAATAISSAARRAGRTIAPWGGRRGGRGRQSQLLGAACALPPESSCAALVRIDGPAETVLVAHV
eukprot:4829450-Prymnesium_polylepis.2